MISSLAVLIDGVVFGLEVPIFH